MRKKDVKTTPKSRPKNRPEDIRRSTEMST